jgi:hypothetical protein
MRPFIPSRVGVFWSGVVGWRPGERLGDWFVSAGIRWFSRKRGTWRPAMVSHMGLLWGDEKGWVELHEATYPQGYRRRDFGKLLEFAETRAGRVWFGEIEDAWSAAVGKAYWESCADLNDTGQEHGLGYSPGQIAVLALCSVLVRMDVGVEPKPGRNAVVCSETAARRLFEFWPRWDLRETPGEGSFDGVTPAGALERWEALGGVVVRMG